MNHLVLPIVQHASKHLPFAKRTFANRHKTVKFTKKKKVSCITVCGAYMLFISERTDMKYYCIIATCTYS